MTALVEVNDVQRQAELRRCAEALAAELSERTGVVAVWLSGSVARGPVNEASDLDLHVVVAGGTNLSLPPWRFGPRGVIENAHEITTDRLTEGLRASSNTFELARWFHATSLGDELDGSVCLFVAGEWSWTTEAVSDLVRHRRTPEIAARLSAEHALQAARLASEALRQRDAGYRLDAHNSARFAAQSLLTAAMIRCGWIVRGSKKRPEIARGYAGDHRVVAALDLLEDVVGIEGMTVTGAREICQARLEWRQAFGREIHRLSLVSDSGEISGKRLKDEANFQDRHNVGATDYYRPLVEAGFFRGPVNHIRALSGFPHVARRLAYCFDSEGPGPISRWVQGAWTSTALSAEWLAISDLTASPPHIGEVAHVIESEAEAIISEGLG